MSDKTQIELGQFLSELNKESDRGSVLIAASIFDEWLSEIIQAHLLNDKVAKGLLNGATAPLSSFAARTGLAYALGLIMEHEYKELNNCVALEMLLGIVGMVLASQHPKYKINWSSYLGLDPKMFLILPKQNSCSLFQYCLPI
ncbi:TPA: hypothetical protein OCB35_003134 [Escherichia coli]|nr:hypothetical protein [Escherichia coli]HCO9692442.1 hypothetical protein [Escherichia coli]HCP0100235.1 hypothetical protein [Escherichia coli]